MPRLFLSKLPKFVPAAEVEDFLRNLFPDATHVQLLQGSHSGEHKGHAYTHFADEAALQNALRQLEGKPPPVLHGTSINVKRASRLGAPEGKCVTSRPLPPQLACYSCSTCACVSSALVDDLENVVARCDLSGGVTAVAFQTEEEMTAAVTLCSGGAERCLPPVLPQLLSWGTRKRRRTGRGADESGDSCDGQNWEEEETKDVAGGGDVVTSLERRGFVPLQPAAVLALLRDFMDGRGRIAVKDQRGHMAVLSLPAHAAQLE